MFRVVESEIEQGQGFTNLRNLIAFLSTNQSVCRDQLGMDSIFVDGETITSLRGTVRSTHSNPEAVLASFF